MPARAVSPQQMEREEVPPSPGLRPTVGVALLHKVIAIYGYRHALVLERSPPAPLSPLHCPLLVCRGVDPSRLSERERRNEIPEADRTGDAEVLVLGHFREDPADGGYRATRWLSLGDAARADNFSVKFDEFSEHLESMRQFIEEGGEPEGAEAAGVAAAAGGDRE